ncbi:hypothetical protein MIMGU_mgv1a013308mg [Erythranthe guttata]|uniref:Uncharacterized protein n=1 Tax=Erythranthe guttata TaxID=4155 RepID=A0A022RJA7_ERYGU|nr:hypothetical protein MIMGU_mgv1a013308mg [Erythranthe guttata]
MSQPKPYGVRFGLPSAAKVHPAAAAAEIQPPAPERRRCCSHTDNDLGPEICCGLLGFNIIILLFLLISNMKSEYPKFNVESVSVSLFDNLGSNDSSHAVVITASEWNLGFSIDDSESMLDYTNQEIREISVFFMCVTQNWTGTVFKAGKYRDLVPVLFNATVNTLLHNYTNLPRLDFKVRLQVMYHYDHRLDVTCNNMTVDFLPNATKGIMTGGPTLCHLDSVF